jgi:low temperature requirement protein LtrA
VVPAFDGGDFVVITIGYVIMRLAMVAQWTRAARSDPPRRATALRYAIGVTCVQIGWLVRLALPEDWGVPAFLLLVVGELLVPIIAERAPGGPTTWHPHHIAERYGLFTIIMLGEAVAAATIAIRTGLDLGEHVPALVSLAVAGLVIVFALWWLYFDRSAGGLLTSLRVAMLWGYGHYFIFASAAAVGAGLSVAVDHYSHPAHVPAVVAGYALAVPVAFYLFFVWLLHIRPHRRRPLVIAYLVGAALTLLAPLGPAPVHVVAGLLAILVGITVTVGRRPAVPAA